MQTEYEIQDWLQGFTRYKNHESQIPNIYLYAWESDFISITRSCYVHEYEIKISRSDFRNDFKKIEKHACVKNGEREPTEWEKGFNTHLLVRSDPRINENGKIPVDRPNYFWYVSPPGVIPVDEVPEYAGLIYTDKMFYVEPIKPAPKLHKIKVCENKRAKINRSYSYKYWALRSRINNNNDFWRPEPS